ncbi:hypothetical protein PLICRDRAFT_199492 [Plicaturopsis crispa FD-325 SS-3]|nr:hypothetical protein PLICRDRAFT_199492 [Plicaturopsis crispa FD-325 SS-3]
MKNRSLGPRCERPALCRLVHEATRRCLQTTAIATSFDTFCFPPPFLFCPILSLTETSSPGSCKAALSLPLEHLQRRRRFPAESAKDRARSRVRHSHKESPRRFRFARQGRRVQVRDTNTRQRGAIAVSGVLTPSSASISRRSSTFWLQHETSSLDTSPKLWKQGGNGGLWDNGIAVQRRGSRARGTPIYRVTY